VKLLIWISVLFSMFLILASYHPNLLSMPVTAGLDFSTGDALSDGTRLKEINLLTVIGGILVFVFYWTKFGQWHGEEGAPPGFKPQPTRHFTTWLRYSSWACFYASIMVGFYLLIVLFPMVFLMIIRLIESMQLQGDLSSSHDLLRSLQNAILLSDRSLNSAALAPYAVIVLILVWAGTFKKLERKARGKLQESALIPNEAQSLIYKLEEIETATNKKATISGIPTERAVFTPDSKLIETIIGKIGLLISEEEFEKTDPKNYLAEYCRCLYFLERLKDVRAESGSSEIWQIYGEDLEVVEQRLDEIRENLFGHREELVQALKYAKKLETYESDHEKLKAEVGRLRETINIRDALNMDDISLENLRKQFLNERVELQENLETLLNKLNDQTAVSKMLRTLEDDLLSYDELTLEQIKTSRENTAVKRLPFEKRYFKRAEKRLKRSIEQCSKLLYQVIVCGVLAVGKSYNQRSQMFKDLGLEMPGLTGVPLNRNFVFEVCLIITGWVGISTLLYTFLLSGPGDTELCGRFTVPYPEGFPGAIVWTTSAVMMHSLGIIGAYIVQNSLLTEHDAYKYNGPGSLVNTDFGMAFLFGFSLNILFFTLMLAANGSFANLASQWKWALVPGVTAYFTGFYIAKSKKNTEFDWNLVLLQGLVTMLMTLIALFWIWDITPADAGTVFTCRSSLVFSFYCLFSGLMVGAILGFLSQRMTPGKPSRS
jgi:hypothetical protein